MSSAWNCYSFKYQLAVNRLFAKYTNSYESGMELYNFKYQLAVSRLFAKYTKLGNVSNLHTSDRPHTVSAQIIINILKSLSGFI